LLAIENKDLQDLVSQLSDYSFTVKYVLRSINIYNEIEIFFGEVQFFHFSVVPDVNAVVSKALKELLRTI